VKYLYAEAQTKLTSAISSPLGTLTLSQVEKGEAILVQLYQLFQEAGSRGDESARHASMAALSKEFYSAIPQTHQPSIDNISVFEEKQDLVQLMKDMLTVCYFIF
jgi:poly [ADP-ribose] polymerase 2/3/4